jgi:hypothetical protein
MAANGASVHLAVQTLGLAQVTLGGLALLPLFLPGLEGILSARQLLTCDLLAPLLAPLPLIGGALLALSTRSNCRLCVSTNWWLSVLSALTAGILSASLWSMQWGFLNINRIIDGLGGRKAYCEGVARDATSVAPVQVHAQMGCSMWAHWNELIVDEDVLSVSRVNWVLHVVHGHRTSLMVVWARRAHGPSSHRVNPGVVE